MRPRPLILFVFAVISFSVSCVAADARTGGIDYRPHDDVLRLQHEAERSPDVGPIIDFARHGDRLYLLNGMGRVTVVERADSAWVTSFEFGREGDGPGEFRYPTSISLHDDVITVTEPTRVQLFALDGTLQSARLLEAPCAMLRPSIALSGDGTYLSGDCLRHGLRTDTLVGVLALSTDSLPFREIAREVRYTRDGTVGNAFNLAPSFSMGSDGTHLFGVGTRNCVWRIRGAQVDSTCPAVRVQYRAQPPDEVRRRLRRASGAVRIEWPDVLPPYVDRVSIAGNTVLVRPFSADSVVLQLAAPDGRDIAVAPFERLVRCHAAGCLWVLEDAVAPKLIYLDTSALARLVGGAR
jgi:hypothetical protein